MRLWAIFLLSLVLLAGLAALWRPYQMSERQPPRALVVGVESGEVQVGGAGHGLRLLAGDTAEWRGDGWQALEEAPAPAAPPVQAPALAARSLGILRAMPAWRVEGQVVDGAGRALAGAEVFLATLEERSRWEFRPPLGVIARRPADASGRFQFSLHAPEAAMVLCASFSGYQPACQALPLEDDAGGRLEYRLVLHPGGTLYGRVRENLTGQPIPGARVLLEEARDFAWDVAPPLALPHEALSDASGQFRLDSLPPLGLFTVQVSAPGYLSRRLHQVKLADAPLSLVLSRGGRLSGFVVERQTGSRMAGATVYAMEDWRVRGQTESDEQGEFTLERLAPGSYRLLARKGPWINWFFADADAAPELLPPQVVVRAGDAPARVTLAMTRGVGVRGRVVNRLTGAPVAGAALRLIGPTHGAPYPEVRSDREGRYGLSGLYPSRFTLVASAPGYAREAPFGDRPGHLARFVVAGGENLSGVDFALEPEEILSGRVLDEAGRGAPDVPVSLLFEESRSGSPLFSLTRAGRSRTSRRATTGPAGEFRLDGLYPGYRVRVVAQAPDRAPVFSPPLFLAAGEGPRDLELVLSAGGAVSGYVRNRAGEPGGGVAIEAHLLEEDGAVLPLGRARSDAAGFYRLAGVPAGTLRVSLARSPAAGPKGVSLTSQTLALGAGEERAGIDFVLDAPNPGGRIAGRVLDERGEPVAGAMVRAGPAGDEGHGEGAVFSRSDGGFELSGLLAERYRLSAYHRDFLLASRPGVEVDAEPVELRLAPAPRLLGRVQCEAGAPVPSYQLRLITLAQRDREARPPVVGGYEIHQQPEGRFAIPINRPGRYRIEVDVEDGRRASTPPIEVGEEDTEELVITVEQRYVLRGQVLEGASRQPVRGAKVAVFSLNRLQLQRRFFFVPLFLGWRGVADSDAEGNFRIAGLGGPVDSVWVWHPDYAVVYLPEVAIEETRERPLRVHLDVGATLEIALQAPEGERAAGRGVQVRFPAHGDLWQEYVLGPDGGLELSHCPPGPARVELTDPPAWATRAHWEGDLASGRRVEARLGALP